LDNSVDSNIRYLEKEFGIMGGMWAMWGKIVRIKKNQDFEELKTHN
jgi:hypothetical protein